MKSVKKILSITCMLLVGFFLLSACTPKKTADKEETKKSSEENTKDTWTDCSSLKEAEDVAEFSYSLPDVLGGGVYHADKYRALKGKILEIIYKADDAQLIVRQAPGEGQDISEDDSEFSHDYEDEIVGISVHIKGNKDFGYVDTFSYDGNSYALIASDGLSYDEIEYVLKYELLNTEDEGFTEKEPTEGAPYAEEGRFIDKEPVDDLSIAGAYQGIEYGEAKVSMYTDSEENAAEVGNIEIKDKDGNNIYSGVLIKCMDNLYEIKGTNADISIYTDNGNINFELYVDGEHSDYFVMTEAYES